MNLLALSYCSYYSGVMHGLMVMRRNTVPGYRLFSSYGDTYSIDS